jgi:hypothetical protein
MRGEIPNVVRYLLGMLVGLIYGIAFCAMHYSSQSMPGLAVIILTTAICFVSWAIIAQEGLRQAFSAAFKAWRGWKEELDTQEFEEVRSDRIPMAVQKTRSPMPQ